MFFRVVKDVNLDFPKLKTETFIDRAANSLQSILKYVQHAMVLVMPPGQRKLRMQWSPCINKEHL